ncbi:MAG: magnesium/cobalt transporter CorA [candidate division Zixibacteria bacterium]|nr:magnesium/cobalt transporter CorA [candidate division Zixibacteria bacterium]
MIRSFYYVPGQGVTSHDGIADFDAMTAVEGSILWVDMKKPTDQELFVLTHDFKFHPLAIEDVIAERSRTKIDDYERYLFLVFHAVDYIGREEGLKVSEMNFFLTKNSLVTVRHGDHRTFDHLYSRAERDERLVTRGADYLFHAIIDAVVDNYNTTLEIIESEVDGVEDDVLGQADEDTLKSIFTLRRDIVQLKRIVAPQREVVNQLTKQHYSLITPNLNVYFSDIHDHLVRIIDMSDSHREILNTSLEVYYSSVSTKTNDIIKFLTVLTAVFIPPTLVSGIWGMNFENLPGHDWEHGFLIIMGFILVLIFGMLIVFRRKKWI